MNCVIRDSHEDDMTQVHAIYSYHVLHGSASFEEEPPSLEELARRRADVLRRGLPYLVLRSTAKLSATRTPLRIAPVLLTAFHWKTRFMSISIWTAAASGGRCSCSS